MSIAKRASKILFYGVPATTESGAVTYHRMTNFTEATTSKNPKEYSRQYVDEESERSDVVGYAPSTSYAFDLDPENPVHKDIVSITDGEKIGPEAVPGADFGGFELGSGGGIRFRHRFGGKAQLLGHS